MKLFYLLAFLIALTFSSLFAQTTCNAPRIIRTVPAFGDCNVDPNLKEITFEFDQDMMTTWSFIDCPNPIPLGGELVWKTKRILSLSVQLAPNRIYQSKLNSNQFQGFMSEQGIPMDATYFLFRTKIISHTANIDTILNRTNYEKFCTYFLKYYSYKDLHGINWKKQLDSIKGDIVKSESENEYGVRLLQILKKANDPHLTMEFSNQSFNCADIHISPVSFNYYALFFELSDLQSSLHNSVYTGKAGEAGYVLVQSLDVLYTEDVKFGIARIKEMNNLPFLILDLRLNNGGDEALAKSIVATLLSNPIKYEKVATINESTGLFDNMTTKTLSPSTSSIRYKGKIYVLIGNLVMSSAESMVLMLKQMPNVQIVGSKTYGSSGNPKPFKVTNTVTVNVPSWLSYDMNDKLIEGNGIEPDLKAEFPADDFIGEDKVFEYVKTLMKNVGTEVALETVDSDFQLFPNPVKDMANITLTSPANGKVGIQLIDSNGKVIFNQAQAPQSSANNNLSLKLSPYKLQPGLYFMKLTINNKTTIQKLVYQP